LLAALLIAAGVTAVVGVAASTVPILISSENWARDWRVAELGPKPPVRSDIVVLGLDEKTFDTLQYRSPVDRGFLAELLNYLAKAEVRAVGIDILLDRPTESEKDLALFTALRDFPAPLVVVWADPDADELILTQKQKRYMDANLQGIGKGYANLLDDKLDGVIRWINVRHEAGKDGHPGFPAAIAKSLGHALPDTNILLDYTPWPEDQNSAFPTFSAASFKTMPEKWFASVLKGKIVMIGGVLRDTDRYPTPFVAGRLGNAEGTIPGVVIHAQALAQIIDGRRLNVAGGGARLAIIAAAASMGAALAALTIPIWLMLAAGIVFLAALVASIGAAYPLTGLLAPIFSPGLGFLAALMVMSFYQQRRFHEERTFIRGALSRYVAEDVVKQLEEEPWRLKLGGERRNLSFLFTDIAGFTALSEATEPAVLVAALNQYLDGASRVILGCGGTIDKYIGDAIVVVFGAFGNQDDHAHKAVDCALALDRFAQKFARAQRKIASNSASPASASTPATPLSGTSAANCGSITPRSAIP
jgi:CHASE2 domain-containing sensor protein